MKCYKGTDKKLRCRGFQYEVGKTYETPEARMCETGFHACENPLDVLHYYSPNVSRYFEVDLDANEQTQKDDSKRVGSHITILKEIGISELIQQSYDYAFNQVNWENGVSLNSEGKSIAASTDYRSIAENTGIYSIAANTGNKSIAKNVSRHSTASNTGYASIATNEGNCSIATNTGDCSIAINTGDYGVAMNTGHKSVALNAGYKSVAINTGEFGAAETTGKNSIAIATGYRGMTKGAMGQWLVLAERATNGDMLNVKAFQVDGINIKPDTFYRLENGALVVVE